MKTSSTFLWQLVHLMSGGEKIFFKRNFIAVKSEPLYIKLFNAIALQKKYNEAAIIKKFHPLINKKNIASQKNYLQKLICDAIVQYDSRNDPAHKIYQQILLIRVYRKKGLLTEAHAEWKKAVKKARATESFALVSLLKMEFEKMILSGNVHTPYDDLHTVFKNHVITYTQYVELITLRDMYAEILLIKRVVHYDLDKNLKARISHLLNEVNKCTTAPADQSFLYRHYINMIKSTLFYLQNDINRSWKMLQKTLADWQNNFHFIETHGEYYIELLYMINYAGTLHHSFNYVAEVFNLEINDWIKDKNQRASFEAIKYLALNKIYNKTAQYNEVKKLVQFMKTKYRQWEPLLNSDMNRTVNLSLGIGCFVLEQFDDALYFVKRGVIYFKAGTREEHTAVAQILLLLISYNMDNPRFFDAQYKATYAYFYKRKKKHSFEKALVECLHRTFYMTDNKSKMIEYKRALDVFETNKDNTVQQMTFNIFNYQGWLTSKVLRIPYRQYVETKVKEGSKDKTSILQVL